MKNLILILVTIFFTGFLFSCEEDLEEYEPEETLDPLIEVVGIYDVEYWKADIYLNSGESYESKMRDKVIEIIPDGEGEYALYLDGDWHVTLVLEKNYDGVLYFDIVEYGGIWTSGLPEGWTTFEKKAGSWSKADYPTYAGSFQMNKDNKFELCLWYCDLHNFQTGEPIYVEYITFFSGHRRTSETTVD